MKKLFSLIAHRSSLIALFCSLFIVHCLHAQPQLRMIPCSTPATCKRFTVFHETNSDFKKFNYNSLNLEYLLSCSSDKTVGVRI